MTPQSNFAVIAPIRAGKTEKLRELLARMNFGPGRVNPKNPIFPFARFDDLHFARFVILDDPTTADVAVYGLPRPDYPPSLAFVGDFDGDADEFRRNLAIHAHRGLKRVFSFCEGFSPRTDLLDWMNDHEHPPQACYGNSRGRTVRQCREEERLDRKSVV